jgi:hypothetical protein
MELTEYIKKEKEFFRQKSYGLMLDSVGSQETVRP